MKNTKFIVQAAIIGALYATLTILLAPISYGQLQVRVAEALTILPVFTPAAIPGLFIGCIVANLYGGYGIVDIVFGSLATLVAAYLTHKVSKRFLAPLPPVIINAIVVGFILYYVSHLPLVITIVWVGLGEAIACYGLGYPLMLILDKYKTRIFR